MDGRNQLCVSNEILEEYEEILERKSSHNFARLALDVIINNPYTIFVTPFYRFKVIAADPDDDKFVDCAVAGNGKYIVTDDHHYDVLKNLEFPRMEIIKLCDIIKQI